MAKTVATCQSKSAIPKSNNINMNCRSIIHVGLLAIGSGLGFGQCNFPAPASSNVVNYSFEPIVAQDRMSLQVTLEFKGGRTGKAKLELPSKWAGEKDVLKSITELTALSAQTTVSDTKSPATKQLRFPPNSVVKVSYVLIKDWSGPLNAATRFRSDLSPEYFHIVGPTSLVVPNLIRSRRWKCVLTGRRFLNRGRLPPALVQTSAASRFTVAGVMHGIFFLSEAIIVRITPRFQAMR
jgi:hypothetical protein